MVRRDKNIPWEVIIRKFKCEISEKEQAELDVWLADVENHARFQSWQSLWLSIMEENMRYVSNVDALWKRMEERMRKAEPRMFKLSLRSFRLYIAAVAVLFFLLFSFAGYMTAEWYKASDAVLAYSSLNGKSRICLPDSTFVWLNAGSTLEYFVSRWTKERNVRLDGEAYFDVKHNEDNPFVVGTKSMNVTVLGTEFNVSAYSDIEEFNIALLRGSIELNLPDRSRRYRMTAGEQVFYKKGKYVSAQIGNMDYFKWKEGLLCFNNQPIHVIIDKLRLYYDVRIEVADLPFLEERYSGKFRVKEGIEQVLKVLQLEHKFTYVKDNELNLITIK